MRNDHNQNNEQETALSHGQSPNVQSISRRKLLTFLGASSMSALMARYTSAFMQTLDQHAYLPLVGNGSNGAGSTIPTATAATAVPTSTAASTATTTPTATPAVTPGTWASGGTNLIRVDFPDDAIFDSGSTCTVSLNEQTTLGPCYFEDDTGEDISLGLNGLPITRFKSVRK